MEIDHVILPQPKKNNLHNSTFEGTYAQVVEEIDKSLLRRPNSSEIVSIFYDAWKNFGGEYESEILDLLKNNWIWEYTGNLYLPISNEEINNGIILDLNSKNLKFENGKLIMEKNDLFQRLISNDPYVKFIPFGFKIGQQTISDLEQNPYLIARYENSINKIIEASIYFKKTPYLYSLERVVEPEARISAIGGFWNECWGLGINGGLVQDNYWGFSFGLKEESA